MDNGSVDRPGRTRLEILAEIRRTRRTEQELIEAMREDERQTGRTMTPSEIQAFARGFHGREYAAEVRALAAAGLLDEDAGEE